MNSSNAILGLICEHSVPLRVKTLCEAPGADKNPSETSLGGWEGRRGCGEGERNKGLKRNVGRHQNGLDPQRGGGGEGQPL